MNEELKIKISAEVDEAKKNIKGTKDEVKSFGEKSKEVGAKVGEVFKGIGSVIGTAMKTVGATLAAGVTALVGLAESTREYRTEQAKLTTAFTTAGASAEQAKATYNDLYRVLGDGGQATEAANHLAQLTTNQAELSEWTNICQGVYATFGDSLPIEGLTEAANETAKTGALTGGLADALNWAGIAESEFQAKLDACNTEAEREALIRTTLNGVYSDAAAAYEENAGAIMDANLAQAKMTDALAQLGAAAEPIITIFKSTLADALTTITPHFNTISEGLMDIIKGVDGGAEKMANGISSLMTSVVDTITKALPTVLDIGIKVVVSLIQGIVQALPQVVTAIVNALPALIQGIVTAFQAIVEALPTIIKSIVDALPTLLPALIDGIITMIVTLCENFSDIIMPIIDALPGIVISVIEALIANLQALIGVIITFQYPPGFAKGRK